MKIIFLLILLLIPLLAEELVLDNLLKEYEYSQELYHKTKKESAGHIIVFSRSDLDKMQAYTLNDVLKTLRMFNIQTTQLGMTTLVKSSSSQVANNPVRIYINSHELNAATLGNALTQYGKMNLYFIDHIEVYQAGNSVSFGNEPGSMIIKLYTKEPSRENVTSLQTSVDTRSSLNFQSLDARVIDKDYNYLLNIDVSKNNYETYQVNDSELSRDGVRGQLYFKFSKNNSYDIEIGATAEKYDSFNGLGKASDGGEIESRNIYLHMSKYFDNNLKVMLSLSTEKLEVDTKDKNGFGLSNGIFTKHFEANINTKVYAATIEKRFITDSNDLFIGAQIKQQNFNIKQFKNNSVDTPMTWGPQELTIYMAYLENLYNINNNNLLTLSAKIDHYVNDFSKSSTEHIFRLGYVSLIDNSWTFKLFGMQSYVYPTFRQTTFAPQYNINPDLNSAQSLTLTAEAIYNIDKTTITLGGGGSQIEDAIAFSPQEKKYVNKPTRGDFQRVYARVEHSFNIDNKVLVEYYKLYKDKSFSPDNGVLIQLYNKLYKLDIYNELVYKDAYVSSGSIHINAGYDYSLGVIYPIKNHLDIKLKGENLLDKASEVPINGINVPVMERRVKLTVEYLF